MKQYCKNCGAALHDLYCAHCGQKAAVDRISFSFLWKDAIHFLTHLERGFFYTTYQLLVAPGMTVRNFIEGKRKKYQTPVSYFLIWTTIFIVLLYGIEKLFGENQVINYQDYFGPAGSTKFAISHLSIVLVIIMPFQALYLFLLVTKKWYYYFETLVATIYSLGTVIFLQFVFALLGLLFHAFTHRAIDLRISDLFKIGYLSWFSIDFVRRFPVNHKFLRIVSFVILAFGSFTLWRIYGLPFFSGYFLTHHEP